MAEEENCVFKTNGDTEAQQVKAFLAAHGIPAALRGEALRMTHGFTLDGLGVVRVCVPGPLVEKARKLLAEVESGEWSISDEEQIDPADQP